MTDREAFEAFVTGNGEWPAAAEMGNGKYKLYSTSQAFLAWQAATAAERERCAKRCDAIAEDKWALYKGRAPYTGKEPGRASDHTQGQSDGADQCADAIRKG